MLNTLLLNEETRSSLYGGSEFVVHTHISSFDPGEIESGKNIWKVAMFRTWPKLS